MSSNSSSGCISQRLKAGSQRNICTPMFIAALFTTAKPWKKSKYPLRDEWIIKMLYIHTMEYHSALKKKEILKYATTWMDLEIVIASEVSQTKTNII